MTIINDEIKNRRDEISVVRKNRITENKEIKDELKFANGFEALDWCVKNPSSTIIDENKIEIRYNEQKVIFEFYSLVKKSWCFIDISCHDLLRNWKNIRVHKVINNKEGNNK